MTDRKMNIEFTDNLDQSITSHDHSESSLMSFTQIMHRKSSDNKGSKKLIEVESSNQSLKKASKTTLLSFDLNITLLNLFRQPQIKNNRSFDLHYIRRIKNCLKAIKQQKEALLYVIYIHLIFVQIQNLDQLVQLGQNRQKILVLSNEWNHTNIMNPHCIYENIIRLQKSLQKQEKQFIIHSELAVDIIIEDDIYTVKNNRVFISKNMIDKAISAKGFLDVYLCPLIINKFQFLGVYRGFSNCQNIEKTQINYAKTFYQLLDQTRQPIDFEKWYHDQVKKILRGQCDYVEIQHIITSWYENQWIQKLLIGLMGWKIDNQEAIKLLNIYYDRSDWQLRSALHPTIAQCEDKFHINYLIQNTKQHRQNIIVCAKCPCFNEYYNDEYFSWHKPKLNQYVGDDATFLWVHLNLGFFPKCGFYDWKLFMFQQRGKNQGVNKIFNLNQNKKLGSQIFQKKTHWIKRVQGRIIVHPQKTRQLQMHQIYLDLIGSQQTPSRITNFKDIKKQIQKCSSYGVNCVYLMGVFQRDTGQFGGDFRGYKHPHASPLALTCRKTPCKMLGGGQFFKYLKRQSQKLGVKIITDCTLRICSSRINKKYAKLVLNTLDNMGRKQVYYGADGRSMNYEQTMILNYRKKQAWDLLFQQLVQIIQTYNIDGIYLDNGFTWPPVFEINQEQLFRNDVDNTRAYTQDEIFQGQVVNKGKNAGYWRSKMSQTYANPFFVQLCKKLWQRYPNFLILCEQFESTDNTDKTLSIISSGPIPRSFKMPRALSQIMGQYINQKGDILKATPKDIATLKKWYIGVRKLLPKNAIIVQSTTNQTWPYPAFIFKQATWAFIDLFFFLPDIPMTFIGQHEGKAFRTKATNIFLSVQTNQKIRKRNSLTEENFSRINSSFFKQIQINPNENYIQSSNKTIRNPSQIKYMQENFRKEIGPQFGFDLAEIHKHYLHRSKLRKQQPLLQQGNMLPIAAQHLYGVHNNVLSFIKWNQQQMLLVAINFNDSSVDLHFNLQNVKNLFIRASQSTIVLKIKDLFVKRQQQYYTVGQIINSRIQAHIDKYQSLLWKTTICDDLQKAYEQSTKRVVNCLKATSSKWIYSSVLTNQLIRLVQTTKHTDTFIKGLTLLYDKFIKPYNIEFNLLIAKIHKFWIDKSKITKLFGIFKLIKDNQKLDLVLRQSINYILNSNKLGPIAFITPQIGKWSSIGGLGVMVDQLTKQLAKLGEQVYVVTPYYEYNKKNKTNYLIEDGFKYDRNITVHAAHFVYQFGVHCGKLNGVNFIWLHNPQLFSKPYQGQDALYVSKQLVAFALATLQVFCQLKLFPSLAVTNDWMCGFVSAYVKNSKFKDVFNGTKFMHICHNLGQLYEGRLYPKYQEGDLAWLIQLPQDWYIQYRNNKLVINPSKCALTTCDNWGTVSNSYKYDLLKDSPLSYVLWRYPSPFSFPNGVRKQQRLQIIHTQTPGNHLDSKKLLQEKYFGFQELQNQFPLFSFIGRITKQKGVHLIVDAIQALLYEYNFRLQFLIGGCADQKQLYGKYCAEKMRYLTNKFPKCVWSNPSAFFGDGALGNIGSDFAMMPSQFEPGGIVQHQFFAGSTPVVAFKTGGLKDTVFQYDYKTQKGNGFNFMSHETEDFKNCMRRAIQCYKNKKHYQKLRQNAFESVVEEEDVAKGWNTQFYRLQNKVYVEEDLVKRQIQKLDKQQSKNELQVLKPHSGGYWKQSWQLKKQFKQVLVNAARLKGKSHTFIYQSNKIPRPKDVYISGSWDDWQKKQKLHFSQLEKNWTITLKLVPKSYLYKYNVDNQWVLTKNNEVDIDINNNENHIVVIQ